MRNRVLLRLAVCGAVLASFSSADTALAQDSKDRVQPEPMFAGKTARQWLEQFHSKELGAQDKAMLAIGLMGKKAALPILPELLEQLGSALVPLPVQPSFAVSSVRQPTHPLKRLIESLGDDAIPVLIRGLEHEKTNVRWVSLTLLAAHPDRIPNAAELFTRFVRSDDLALQLVAARALITLGPKAKTALPDAVKRLANAGGENRLQLALLVAAIEPNNQDAHRVLLDLSEKPREDLSAARKKLTGVRNEDVDELVGRLSGNRYDYKAPFFLKDLGPAAKSAIPALTDVVKRAQVKYEPKGANFDGLVPILAAVGRDDPDTVVPILMELLKQYRAPGQPEGVGIGPQGSPGAVIRALGEFGPAARDAVKLIRPHLAKWPIGPFGPGPQDRHEIALAMLKIDPTDDEALRAYLAETPMRQGTFGYLDWTVGTLGRPALPTFRKVLAESKVQWDRSRLAAWILMAAPGDADATAAIVSLADTVGTGEKSLRYGELFQLEFAGAGSLPAATKLLGHAKAQPGAIALIQKMGPAAKEAVPALMKNLPPKGESVWNRAAFADALSAIGPDASAALPMLREMLAEGEYYMTRLAAARALFAIAPKDETAHKFVRDEFKRYIAAYEAKKDLPKSRSMSFELFRDRCMGDFTRLALEVEPEETIRLNITSQSFPYRTLWYPPDEALLPKLK